MPCYTINLVSVKFKAENRKLLLKVLKENNFNPRESNNLIFSNIGTFDLNNEKVQTQRYNQSNINIVKQKYSEKIIEEAVNINNWILEKTDNNEFVVNKW